MSVTTLPAPDLDHIAEAPGWWHGKPTIFRLRLWRLGFHDVALVTEIASNTGPSVTNNIEGVHAYLARMRRPFTLVEHYDEGSYEGGRGLPDTFDVVTFTGRSPQWRRVSFAEFADLVS